MQFFRLTLILLILLSLVSSQKIQIKPQYSLWVDYNKVVPIDLSNPIDQNNIRYYRVNIPCEARIGKCKYEYIIIPQGWKNQTNGSLLAPQKVMNKNQTFVVHVNLAQQMGDRMNARLVLNITDNKLYTKDIGIFKSQLLNLKPYYQSTYDESFLTRTIPDGFPNEKQIQQKVSQMDKFFIDNLLSRIMRERVKCGSARNYYKKILQILQRQIVLNNNTVNQKQLYQSNLNNKLLLANMSRIQRRRQLGVEGIVNSLKKNILMKNEQLSFYRKQSQLFSFKKNNAQYQLIHPPVFVKDRQLNISTYTEMTVYPAYIAYSDKLLGWIEASLKNRILLSQAISQIKFRMLASKVKPGNQKAVNQIKQQYMASEKQRYRQQVKYLLTSESMKNKIMFRQKTRKKKKIFDDFMSQNQLILNSYDNLSNVQKQTQSLKKMQANNDKIKKILGDLQLKRRSYKCSR